MITKTEVICSTSNNPYHNIALEEYLLNSVDSETVILYLWQNKQTVVIGQNQNAWQECKVKELEEDGGHLARRLSGGGAVFHDLGNLNFTFLVPRKEYDVAKQSDVIRVAAASYGLDVERTGRNDILIGGRKFSGNAFFKRGDTAYHHGTILISSDMKKLSQYLNVSKAKLESKGVQSVSARVANLTDFCKDVTIEGMKERLTEALSVVYGIAPRIMTEEECDQKEIKRLEEKFESWEWRFGKKIPFQIEFGEKFPWGEISIQLAVESGVITDAAVYSDAMDSFFISKVADAIKGQKYSSEALKTALSGVELDTEFDYEAGPQLIEDIKTLISKQNF